jgi:hypothetical protein
MNACHILHRHVAHHGHGHLDTLTDPATRALDSKADSARRGARHWRRPSAVCLPPKAEEVLERPALRMSLLGDTHARLYFFVHAASVRTLSGAAKHHACILAAPMHIPDLGPPMHTPIILSRPGLSQASRCGCKASYEYITHTTSSGRGRT